ncbi:MAG TPA: prepilin-type N-terminal cleavage/methylation domain-containing protein [Syntrophomonadaceae bacterium]|nr:prepilin-type N-terminal cleavage/methylation domain-containing protein [Syntrophomonadaceae bacterium]
MLIKMREMMRRNDNQKGFTLIELLVVMAILAILAAMAIPKFTGVTAKAKQDANDSNVDLIANATEVYYDSHNRTLPTDVAALVSGGYLKENPTQPVKGSGNYAIAAGSGHTLNVKPGKCSGGVPAEGGSDYDF